MNQNKIISLPFWETIKRSFLYPIINIGVVMKIVGIWFLLLVYEVANGYPTICKLTQEGCDGISQNIAMLLLSFASISIAVAFSRNVILKTQYDKLTFSFGKKEWKYLGYNLLIILIVAVPSLLLIILASYLASVLHLTNIASYVFIIPLAITIVCSRFYLVLPATAVGNKSMDLKTSFALTKGNANKIFWGQILLMLPIALTLLIISAIFAVIGSDSFIVKFLFVTMVMFLSFFDTCVKVGYYSHIYQYFLFFQDNKEEPAKITPVKEVAKVEVVAKPKKVVAKKAAAPKKVVAKKETAPKKTVAPKKKTATAVKKKPVAKK